MFEQWREFIPGRWQEEIDVRDFVQKNYTPYIGDDTFLAGPTDATKKLWNKVSELMKEETKKGILDADTTIVAKINSHNAGYIEKELEKIVGIQTDKPLKRAIMPNGGLNMVKKGLQAYGYTLDPKVEEVYTKFRKSHNDGVFDVYTEDMRKARKSGIITGLPDAYGRGRIIGDYRRVALYGVDRLIQDREEEKLNLYAEYMESPIIRQLEEFAEQIRALKELKEMAASYGFDISNPASNAVEAVQWTYFGYLAAVKEQNGAAMSLGRVSTFLDIYIEKDIAAGKLTEEEAHEIIDHFVMKLRMVRFLRTPDYDQLFSENPTWVTESLGGMGVD